MTFMSKILVSLRVDNPKHRKVTKKIEETDSCNLTKQYFYCNDTNTQIATSPHKQQGTAAKNSKQVQCLKLLCDRICMVWE